MRSKFALAAALALLATTALAAPLAPLVLGSGIPRQIAAGDSLRLPAPATDGSVILTPGAAPSSPSNGACWTTVLGLYCQINSAIVGPFSVITPPGGTTGQIQFNNGGVFGGVSGLTSNGSNLALSTAGAASTPGVTVSGAPYTGGTTTTNFPQTYLNAGATGPTTFSAAGTMFGINAPSGFTGSLLDAHVNGGLSVFVVDYQGNITAARLLAGATNSIGWSGRGLLTSPVINVVQFGAADGPTPAAQTIRVSSVAAGNANTTGAATTTIIGSLANGSGTNGSFTFQVGQTAAASGVQVTPTSAFAILANSSAGLTQHLVVFSAAGTPVPTCAAGLKGAEGTVSDATAPTYLGTYTSGGAVVAPVTCNGTTWVTY